MNSEEDGRTYHSAKQDEMDLRQRIVQVLEEGGDKEAVRALLDERRDSDARRRLEESDFRFNSRALRESFLETLRSLGKPISEEVWHACEVMQAISDGMPLSSGQALFIHEFFARLMDGSEGSTGFFDPSVTTKRRQDLVRNTQIASRIIERYVRFNQSVSDAWEEAGEHFHVSSETAKSVWQKADFQRRGFDHFSLTVGTIDLSASETRRLNQLLGNRDWYRMEFGDNAEID